VTDIVAFVRARLDEDEQVARAASAGGAWTYAGGDSVGAWTLYDEHWTIADLKTYQYEEYDYAARMPRARDPQYVDADANGAHIARHDPARVLREVEATRAIVARYADALRVRDDDFDPADEAMRKDRYSWGWADWHAEALEPVVRLLALPYSDHPDWREEWALPTS
jgi:hypothetical protein